MHGECYLGELNESGHKVVEDRFVNVDTLNAALVSLANYIEISDTDLDGTAALSRIEEGA